MTSKVVLRSSSMSRAVSAMLAGSMASGRTMVTRYVTFILCCESLLDQVPVEFEDWG